MHLLVILKDTMFGDDRVSGNVPEIRRSAHSTLSGTYAICAGTGQSRYLWDTRTVFVSGWLAVGGELTMTLT